MKKDNKNRNRYLLTKRIDIVVRLNTRVKVGKRMGINLEWD